MYRIWDFYPFHPIYTFPHIFLPHPFLYPHSFPFIHLPPTCFSLPLLPSLPFPPLPHLSSRPLSSPPLTLSSFSLPPLFSFPLSPSFLLRTQCLRIQYGDCQIKEEREEMGLRYYGNDIHKTSSFIRHTVASTICYPISLD